MTPVFDNAVVQLYQGDARQVLRELPAESAHCVVTSPPYWALRDYGLAALVWGGDDGHGHEWGEPVKGKSQSGSLNGSTLDGAPPGSERRPEWSSAFCPCGAWRGSLGLEPTTEMYVQHIVEIFREVRRVLRKDGTLWLNMGDSYAGGNVIGRNDADRLAAGLAGGHGGGLTAPRMGELRRETDLKPKDLCGIPWRVAFALQADGWWLRSDIVWSKPNPMPESVTDRPTRAHEYLFLLTKAERYYYDADAIRESSIGLSSHDVTGRGYFAPGQTPQNGNRKRPGPRQRALRERGSGDLAEQSYHPAGRNKRSVWEIATEAYPEAHFATFPQKLVEPCILAGTSERGDCPECGAPWERVVMATGWTIGRDWNDRLADDAQVHRVADKGNGYERRTTGWRPTCGCDREETVPATVLDPFAGSGTVAYVAQRLGRRAIGIDLSAEYLTLAEKRLRGQTLPMTMELTS